MHHKIPECIFTRLERASIIIQTSTIAFNRITKKKNRNQKLRNRYGRKFAPVFLRIFRYYYYENFKENR